MLIPDVRNTLSDTATRNKIQHDAHTRSREFLPGDRVWAYSEKIQKFVDACITRHTPRTGVWSYEVEMEGVIRRRHADQLRRRHYVPPTVTEMGDVTDSC